MPTGLRDSHLLMCEEQREDGAVRVLSLVYTSHEDDNTEFQLLANQQGKLGPIRTVLRATSADDAWKTTYRLLNPFLCDLSYRHDRAHRGLTDERRRAGDPHGGRHETGRLPREGVRP